MAGTVQGADLRQGSGSPVLPRGKPCEDTYAGHQQL